MNKVTHTLAAVIVSFLIGVGVHFVWRNVHLLTAPTSTDLPTKSAPDSVSVPKTDAPASPDCVADDVDYLLQPRVIMGHNVLDKALAYEGRFPGGVRMIQVGDYDREEGEEIVVVGQTGVVMLAKEGFRVRRKIEFKDANGEPIWFGLFPSLVDVNGDGSFEIMQGGGGYGDVGLLDKAGRRLWAFHPSADLPPHRMAVGDLNRDGVPEFYAADDKGLSRLDANGREAWKVTGGVNSVDILPARDGNPPLAVTIGDSGVVRFYNHGGDPVRQFVPPMNRGSRREMKELGVIDWPSASHILGHDRSGDGLPDTIVVMDLEGEVVFTSDLGGSSFVHYFWTTGARGTALRFRKDEPPYFAVLTQSSSAHSKTLLSIFSPSGALVYQEILEGGAGIRAVPDDKRQNEFLLVGDGHERIWAYRLAPRF